MHMEMLDNICKEFGISQEMLFEFIAQACREHYGIIEIENITNDAVDCFYLGKNQKLAYKTIKITREGEKKIKKSLLQIIRKSQEPEREELNKNTFNKIIKLVQDDITAITKSEIKFRILSSRELNEKEQKMYPNVERFVVVRANKYLMPSDKKYFQMKTKRLNSRLRFILD